jgi:hypothetical protein
MSNTKIRPWFATLIGPVYASSMLYRENFRANGMKECANKRVVCHAITRV